MKVSDLTPEQVSRAVVRILLDSGRQCSPEQFRSFLCGGIVANVVGNLPDDYWQKFIKVEICREPGCDCYKMQQLFVETLQTLRDDFRRHLAEKNGGGFMRIDELIQELQRFDGSRDVVVLITKRTAKNLSFYDDDEVKLDVDRVGFNNDETRSVAKLLIS